MMFELKQTVYIPEINVMYIMYVQYYFPNYTVIIFSINVIINDSVLFSFHANDTMSS